MGIAFFQQTSYFIATDNLPFPPQRWDYKENIQELNKIDANQIISYDDNGNVCSFYGDMIWKLTYSINPKQHEQLNFGRITDESDLQVSKRLMFALIHFSKGKRNSIKAPGTLKEYFGQVILPMQKYAKANQINLSEFFRLKHLITNY
jgi:hypothetical protein